jgi:hypothetical protein
VKVHEGPGEERVDVQVPVVGTEGMTDTYHHISRRKVNRPDKNFCADPDWMAAVVASTGFLASEILHSP